MNNRVRHLDLQLTLPPELREQSFAIAQQLREGFISEVVESVAEQLHAKFGHDAIIEIPLLEVKWDGQNEILTNYDLAIKTGIDIADQLIHDFDEQSIDRVQVTPATATSLRVFRNRAHKLALNISTYACQQQRTANLITLYTLEQDWQELCQQGSKAMATGLQYICDIGETKSVVESLGIALIQMAVSVYPLSQWPQPLKNQVSVRILSMAPDYFSDSSVDVPTETSSKPFEGDNNTSTNNVVSDKTSFQKRENRKKTLKNSLKTNEQEVEKYLDEQDNLERTDKKISDKKLSDKKLSDKLVTRDQPEHIEKSVFSKQSSETNESEATLEQGSDSNLEKFSELDRADVYKSEINVVNLDRKPEHVTTHYAGLVYMLNLIMKIELPEILWCCGIDEKSFLFDVCSFIIGTETEHEPVLNTISGIEVNKSNYKPVVVSAWAWSEIVQKVHMRLHELIKQPAHYEFCNENIESLAKTTHDDEASWQNLIEIVAKLLTSAFLDLVHADDKETIDTYINLHGWFEFTDEGTILELPMDSINIDIRRAALDVNPGYLQWCRYTVYLEFVGNS